MCALSGSIMRLATSPPIAPTAIYTQTPSSQPSGLYNGEDDRKGFTHNTSFFLFLQPGVFTSPALHRGHDVPQPISSGLARFHVREHISRLNSQIEGQEFVALHHPLFPDEETPSFASKHLTECRRCEVPARAGRPERGPGQGPRTWTTGSWWPMWRRPW